MKKKNTRKYIVWDSEPHCGWSETVFDSWEEALASVAERLNPYQYQKFLKTMSFEDKDGTGYRITSDFLVEPLS